MGRHGNGNWRPVKAADAHPSAAVDDHDFGVRLQARRFDHMTGYAFVPWPRLPGWRHGFLPEGSLPDGT